MKIVESTLEQLGPGRFRITTIVEVKSQPAEIISQEPKLGEGPTGDAVPDKIVKALIRRRPGSASVAELQQDVGGNPGTVNRQAWTLASNAPDLQIRLRGWVVSPERGRYALSPTAVDFLAGESFSS